jgi:hypothetical protein
MMATINLLLNLSACLWLTLGALVLLGYAKRSLYSAKFVRYYVVGTIVLVGLAVLSRYVRMEE